MLLRVLMKTTGREQQKIVIHSLSSFTLLSYQHLYPNCLFAQITMVAVVSQGYLSPLELHICTWLQVSIAVYRFTRKHDIKKKKRKRRETTEQNSQRIMSSVSVWINTYSAVDSTLFPHFAHTHFRNLKETLCKFFRVHNCILSYTLNILTCFGVQKTHRFPHTVRCYSTVFLLCLKHSVFRSCLFKAPSPE